MTSVHKEPTDTESLSADLPSQVQAHELLGDHTLESVRLLGVEKFDTQKLNICTKILKPYIHLQKASIPDEPKLKVT